jgi:predicted branched-subunit amino acid permease
MNPILRLSGFKRVFGAQLTIDESTGVATSQESLADQRKGFWATGISVFIFWNLMTLLGALLGDALGDPKVWGLDAAAAAAFLGLLWPRLTNNRERSLAIAAMALSLAATPFVAAGIPIISTALLAVAFGWKARP